MGLGQRDRLFMRRCISLAELALGRTYPNPLVGSVIVHQDRIIGEAFHSRAGGAHAEINAINSVKDKSLLKRSSIYVSLEPCSHIGKTPPCCREIVKAGIPRVVIGCLDPHEKVNGKGEEFLKNAGAEVVSRVLEDECKELNKRFFTFHRKKRPYIILKWAESMDSFLDRDFRPVAVGNALSKQWVHQMRAREQGILVGTQTAFRDNPSLTVRELAGRNPTRILIDRNLILPPTYNIFDPQSETLVFNAKKSEQRGNVHFIQIDFNHSVLWQMMDRLYARDVQSLLVEGGSFTHQQFIGENLWDEAVLIRSESLYLQNGTLAPRLGVSPVSEQVFRDNRLFFFKNFSAA